MKISILQHIAGHKTTYKPLYDLTHLNKKRYARLYGYDYIVYKNLRDNIKHKAGSWHKLLCIMQAIRDQHDCDYFAWMDLDTLIMNPEVNLESYIEDKETDHIIGGDFYYNINGKYNLCIADGFLLIKNNTKSLQIFKNIYYDKRYLPKGILYDPNPIQALLAEEYAMGRYYQENHDNYKYFNLQDLNKFISLVPEHNPERFMETMPWFATLYKKGDFIIHAALLDNKLEALENYMEEAV